MITFEFFCKLCDWIGLTGTTIERRTELYEEAQELITKRYSEE